MASLYSDRSDHFPRIPRQGQTKASSRAYLEDTGVDVRDLWKDHGNERQFVRNSPPTIGGFRRTGSQNSSGTNSPVQKRNEERDLGGVSSRMSPCISLELQGSSMDEGHLLRDKISRLQQDREHLGIQLSHYRELEETAQTDLAAEKVSTDSQKQELKEIKHKLSEREQHILDLKCDVESNKQNAARQAALIHSLRGRVRDAEDAAMDKENIASRNDVTIISLRKEMQNQQDRLQQVESSLKHHISAEEEAAKRAVQWESKYGDLRSRLSSALHIDATDSATMESLVAKVSELARERKNLHEKFQSLSRNLHESNLDSKASRETIMRLVSEVGKEKKATNHSQQTTDSLTRERDSLQQKIREMEIHSEQLNNQLASSQDAWSTTQKELHQSEAKLHSVEHTLHTSEYTGQASQSRLHKFKRHLAQVLSEVDESISDEEEAILSTIKNISRHYSDIKSTDESLKIRCRNLNEELDSQRNLHRTTLKRATQAEEQLKEAHERVTGLEGELLTSDVERDRLRDEKRKFVLFCEKLARVMKLDEIAGDVGFDLNGDALVARGEQLVKLEAEALDDRRTTIYNLQRRLKWAKQQLESKELHQGLMRKKVSDLEELLKEKGRVEVERDDNSIRVKKIVKQNEKLQRELLEYKQHVVHLKAKLLESSELRVKTLEQGKTIEDLEHTVNKLAKSKHKTSTALAGMKNDFEASACEARETKAHSSASMQQLARELESLRTNLEETRLREKQLLDFRQVLARLLGLDMNALSVPDYEIISRLERLVQAHHAHSITTHSLEASLHDMENGFRSGYQDSIAILRTPSPVKAS